MIKICVSYLNKRIYTWTQRPQRKKECTMWSCAVFTKKLLRQRIFSSRKIVHTETCLKSSIPCGSSRPLDSLANHQNLFLNPWPGLCGGSNKVVFPCGPSQLNCPFIGKLPHLVILGGLPAARSIKELNGRFRGPNSRRNRRSAAP